jgi:hypothetical protein
MQDTGKKRQNMKDQFYTKREVAETCVKRIIETLPWTLETTTLWIEPSAGSGAFLNHASQQKQQTIALDLDPQHPSIQKQDFLEFTLPLRSLPIQQKRIFFGNPPFGRQGSLSKKFVKHCIDEGEAEAIAFILPRSAQKPSMYSYIPRKYHLVFQEELPPNSFEVNKKDYDVPCVFQIWEKKETLRPEEQPEAPRGFEYVKRTDSYDLAFRRVGALAGKTYTRQENPAPSIQSHNFLRFADAFKPRINHIQAAINAHTFPSNTTGPRSLSKPEINEVINRILEA